MIAEQKNWELCAVNTNFLNTFPGANREQLELALQNSQLVEAQLKNNHWIPGMGPTFHGALPLGIQIPGYKKPEISVVMKPVSDYYAAEQEFLNLEIIRRRGLNVPPSIAVLRVDDAGILVTQLVHTAQPLSARDLSYSHHHPSVYTPSHLLEDFGSGIANMHNLGAVHEDLHLGNLGHDFRVDSRPQIIFFDFESSTILSNDELMLKNAGSTRSLREVAKFERFERDAIYDLARFASSLHLAGFPLRRGELLDQLVSSYTQSRTKSYGFTNGKRTRRLLGEFYNQYLRESKSTQSKLPFKTG